MDKDLKRRRVITVAALAVVAGVLAFIAYGGIGENLVYYWGPTEVHAAGDKAVGATIRLGGLVAPGSIVRASTGLEFASPSSTATPRCRCTPARVPPQMFREGIGVVVEGTMRQDGHFESRRLMVSHGNEYRAPGDGEDRDIRELMRSSTPKRPRGHRRMTPALGHGLILLALLLCAIGAPRRLRRRQRGRERGLAWTRRLAYALRARRWSPPTC